LYNAYRAGKIERQIELYKQEAEQQRPSAKGTYGKVLSSLTSKKASAKAISRKVVSGESILEKVISGESILE
jgi:hypothetical protein